MEVATVGILKEIRRVSDPDKAQIIWDGIKVKKKTILFLVDARPEAIALCRLHIFSYVGKNHQDDDR